MNRRRLATLTALALSGLFPLAAPAQTALDDVMGRKLIRIAVPTDFPPYGFVGTDLKPQGLDVDMATYIGAKLGVPVELVPVTSANRIPYLQTKKAELVISTLGKNPEREKVIDFSAAYSPFFQAVFAPKGLAITSSSAAWAWAACGNKPASARAVRATRRRLQFMGRIPRVVLW